MPLALSECRGKRVSCRATAKVSAAASPAEELEWEDGLSPALAAARQAEAEGLCLLACSTMVSGFHGVLKDTMTAGLVKPFRVQVRRGGVRITLGRFGTAEEAALCYARSPEGHNLRARLDAALEHELLADPSPEQVWQIALREGLALLPASNKSGYQNVTPDGAWHRAWVSRNGEDVWLGRFRTAEAAAMAYARTPEGRAHAAAACGRALANLQCSPPCQKRITKKRPRCVSAEAQPHGSATRRFLKAVGLDEAGSNAGDASADEEQLKMVYPKVRLIGPRPVAPAAPGAPSTPGGRRAAARASAAVASSPEPAAMDAWKTMDEMVLWLVDALSPSKFDQAA
jgi:hypothetical protein